MRLTKPEDIEHRMLEMAYTTDADITPPALAYFAPCSIEDAQKVLDDLAARERIELDIHDDGSLHYHLPQRQKFAIQRPASRALQHHPAHPGVAALLSLVIPGAGQVYSGHLVAGIVWFCLVGLGYTLIIPGVILHLLCIASAASTADRGGVIYKPRL